MSQIGWVYLDDYGHRYNVGLYHGPSGNVLIYINKQILYIDFNVIGSKKYSFYLSDDLCEIELEKVNGSFEYGFNINRKADTPKNRLLAKQKKKDLLYTAIFFVVFLICVFGIYLVVSNFN